MGGFDAIPPDPDRDPRIVLERLSVEGEEQFALLRRIGYLDSDFGETRVPADPATFRTDLPSVPTIFTGLSHRTSPEALREGKKRPRTSRPRWRPNTQQKNN